MTERAATGFREAIQAIEKVSAAEIVVVVRPRLRRWWGGNALVGALVMVAVLAFQLFSEDYEFELWTIAVAPLLAAIIGAMLVELIAPVDRLLTPRSLRDAFAREAAHAAFYEHGVHGTKGRTGVLVFISLHERKIRLVGDLAVVERIGDDGLARQAETLAAALPDGEAVATKLAAIASEYATTLPRSNGDLNELRDHVHAQRPRSFRGAAR